jgi:F-type H+-transporting ATPase subunit delta
VRESLIARAYAHTLFTLGERHGRLEEFAVALDELNAALADRTVRTFIETPKINVRAKKAALTAALGERVPPLFMNFINVVFDKRRELHLREIGVHYNALLDEHFGRLHAQVTLARQPTPETEREITEQLSRTLQKQVIPRLRVDENILGGVIVRYGDRVLDGSLRRRLLALRNRLRQTAVPAGGA